MRAAEQMRGVDSGATRLIGRDAEMRVIAECLEASRDARGGALLLRGPAGIGKSSLLAATRADATSRGHQVLATLGVQSESSLPFAGLHQLLRPILGGVDRLPDSYARAIHAVFGMSEGAASSPHLTALAVLHLLGECAESAPVVMFVDDVHWLDSTSAEALAFVARRLESDPIVMIVAIRDGFESPLLGARIPELNVEALTESDARMVLEARAPSLNPTLRDRVLGEAAGNPLALVELSLAVADMAHSALASERLPLTERLERAFADRLSGLTPRTRSFLHVAAADDSGEIVTLLSAASRLAGLEIGLEVATEASTAGFVDVDGHHLRFRHPLMRSAIHQAMTAQERHAAHEALAAVFDGDPDRRAWHRAAAALGKDEDLAAELDAVADRAERRRATTVALVAMERAAHLSADATPRAARLLRALTLAYDLGQRDEALSLLAQINDSELPPEDRPNAALLRETFAQGSWSGASRIAAFADIADRMRINGDVKRGLGTLEDIALRCWWSNPDAATRARVIEVVERFQVPEDDSTLNYILGMAGPVERGAVVQERLSRRWTDLRGEPGMESKCIGMGAISVGDFQLAEQALDALIVQCRTDGWLMPLAEALCTQAWTKIQRGDWKVADTMASEAARMAEETGQPRWSIVSLLAAATIAAYRGDGAAAEALASEGERTLLPGGANPMLALVQFPRGAAALADGRYDEAYHHLRRIFDPTDIAFHPHVRGWVLVDLVEAALHSGHEAGAAALVKDIGVLAARTRSPLLRGALDYARPVLSSEDHDDAFRSSLGTALADWPFMRARLQLAYGLWLRRQRRAADSRTPLREARDAFDALGAAPWGERARQELRASGETSRRRTYELADALSPQELQIAQLAATGLSNKEIGLQLFLSHRTVGSHLYRIFPKLGITARSHLSAALQDRTTQPAS